MATGLPTLPFSGHNDTRSPQSAMLGDEPPMTSRSYYMGSSDHELAFNKGCFLGTRARDTPGSQDYIAVLDFGYMFFDAGEWRQSQFGNPRTTDTVRGAVIQFGVGFFQCSGSDTTSSVIVAWGMNTSGGAIGSGGGNELATQASKVALGL